MRYGLFRLWFIYLLHCSTVYDSFLVECILTHNPTGWCEFHFKCVILRCIAVIISMNVSSVVIFKLILVVNGWGIFCETALIWMSLDHTHDKSTLVQVMAWCHQATNHYLSQCWSRSMSPNGISRPQWVNANHQCRRVPLVSPSYVFSSFSKYHLIVFAHHWFFCRMANLFL